MSNNMQSNGRLQPLLITIKVRLAD